MPTHIRQARQKRRTNQRTYNFLESRLDPAPTQIPKPKYFPFECLLLAECGACRRASGEESATGASRPKPTGRDRLNIELFITEERHSSIIAGMLRGVIFGRVLRW
jgi:hypothetical protein